MRVDRRDKGPHEPIEINEVVHQRVRLQLLVILKEVREADFSYLKTRLSVTDGNLGRHIEVLAGSGYVNVRKGYEGKRPHTWVSITGSGEDALEVESNVLRAILGLS